MKLKALFVSLLAASVLVACGGNDADNSDNANATNNDNNTEENAANNETDAVSAATQTIVSDEDTLVEGFGAEGGWIVIFNEDMTSEQELVVEGDQTNNNGETARKIALYDQDEDRNKTDEYTLTAPSLTVSSESTRIQGGTFAGDVYVEADGFQLVDASIDGNLYFANEDFESSAEIDEDSSVSGSTEVQE